jgi:hypothetical protein
LAAFFISCEPLKEAALNVNAMSDKWVATNQMQSNAIE